jgi:prolyl-tRNA synthetase
VGALLEEIQDGLLAKARAFRDDHTSAAANYDEFKAMMEGRPGFVMAPWCGSAECEALVKSETQATIRNIPFTAPPPAGSCVRCSEPAVATAWFAKAY